MADTRPRRRQTRVLESAGGTRPGRGGRGTSGGYGERRWKHGVRGNRDFARGLTSDLPVKPPRIVLLQRSLSLSICLHPLLHSLHPSPLLLSDRREPRDTNLSFELPLFLASLSFFCSYPFLLRSTLSLHSIAFALSHFLTL